MASKPTAQCSTDNHELLQEGFTVQNLLGLLKHSESCHGMPVQMLADESKPDVVIVSPGSDDTAPHFAHKPEWFIKFLCRGDTTCVTHLIEPLSEKFSSIRWTCPPACMPDICIRSSMSMPWWNHSRWSLLLTIRRHEWPCVGMYGCNLLTSFQRPAIQNYAFHLESRL